MHWRWNTILIAYSLLCVACGPAAKLPPLPKTDVEAERQKQEIDQIRDYFAQLARLHNVVFRLRVANRSDCKDWAWAQIGIDATTAAGLPRKYRSFSREALSLSWTQATVLTVADTSPAAAAGIRPGDQLLTFNNNPVPKTDTVSWVDEFVRRNGVEPIKILIRRNGSDEILSVTPVVACAIPVELKSESALNAVTDDDGIVVYSGILRLAHTDAQLALVIGHEMAHANLGHLRKQRANSIIGWTAGTVVDAGITLSGIPIYGVFSKALARAGARAYSAAFEREADYIGAYYAARAGYDLAGAEDVWRALSLEQPDSIRITTNHPITPVRFVQLRKAAAEIADKKQRNVPLVPELPATQPDAAAASGETVH